MTDLHAMPGQEPIIRIQGEEARILSSDSAVELCTFLEYPRQLAIQEQKKLCGALLHRRMIHEELSTSEYAQLIPASDVPVNEIPDQKIVKLMRAEHAKAMLMHGHMRLGSIDHYRKFEDKEVGDPSEGNCVLSVFDGKKTVIAEVRAGLNDLLFCTSLGDPDAELMRKMQYDAVVEIIDVPAFSAAIARTIQSKASSYSSCKYVRDRAIFGDATSSIERQHFRNGQIAEMLGDARAFLKPQTYAHQKEYRFKWTLSKLETEYLDIECPQIKDFIRLVSS
jgi:hypothetical protein